MKRIYIMRHGKAEWTRDDMEDFDRPLKPRGRKAAAFMGSLLAVHQEIPELIISSTARRAKETTEALLEAVENRIDVTYEDGLYMPQISHMVNLLRGLDASVDSVMLIGHNPACEQLVAHLVSQGDLQMYLPTCGLVCLDADIDTWMDVDSESARMKWFLVPKLFMKKHT